MFSKKHKKVSELKKNLNKDTAYWRDMMRLQYNETLKEKIMILYGQKNINPGTYKTKQF
jgi:hypothetical protein